MRGLRLFIDCIALLAAIFGPGVVAIGIVGMVVAPEVAPFWLITFAVALVAAAAWEHLIEKWRRGE